MLISPSKFFQAREPDTASSAESEDEAPISEEPVTEAAAAESDSDSEVSFKQSPEKLNASKEEPQQDESWLSEDISQYRRQLDQEFTSAPASAVADPVPEPSVPSPPESPPEDKAPKQEGSPPSLVNKSVSEMTYSRRAYTRNTSKLADTTATSQQPEAADPVPDPPAAPTVHNDSQEATQELETRPSTSAPRSYTRNRGAQKQTEQSSQPETPTEQPIAPALQRAATEPVIKPSESASKPGESASQPSQPPSKKFFT